MTASLPLSTPVRADMTPLVVNEVSEWNFSSSFAKSSPPRNIFRLRQLFFSSSILDNRQRYPHSFLRFLSGTLETPLAIIANLDILTEVVDRTEPDQLPTEASPTYLDLVINVYLSTHLLPLPCAEDFPVIDSLSYRQVAEPRVSLNQEIRTHSLLPCRERLLKTWSTAVLRSLGKMQTSPRCHGSIPNLVITISIVPITIHDICMEILHRQSSRMCRAWRTGLIRPIPTNIFNTEILRP